jgi:predicted ATP-grasp superfamily ATP-dependent carboligase
VIETTVPVLVVHRGGYADVAVARTLGRLGVPVYLLAQEGVSMAVWSSRYWKKRTRWEFSRPEEESVACLREIGARLRSTHGSRPVLLTLGDWVAIFIERHGDCLEEEFTFPRPVRPILRALLNKWEMHLLAEQHGIPTPSTACPASLDDVDAFLESARFPIVMKAADKYDGNAPASRILHSRRELMDEVSGLDSGANKPNIILQEYIPGEVDSVWMCNGYFGANPDRPVIYTGKKLRQVSATGIASLAICLPNETVADQTQRFMEGVGYRGCVGIGYRYDGRDGLYKLLDVNARVSGVFRLFAGTNDMDVVRACYLDLTGQDIPVTALQPGRKWMLEDDVIAAVTALRHGRLSIGDWIKSVRGVRELHWSAADDPVPIFGRVGDGLRRAWLRKVR